MPIVVVFPAPDVAAYAVPEAVIAVALVADRQQVAVLGIEDE